MQLLKLVASQVKVGETLPFNVRDEQGSLLLACGQLIFSQGQLEALFARGIFADVEEIKALAAGRKVEAKPPGLFVRWNQIYWSLDSLARPDLDPAALREGCERLGDELEAMLKLDADVAIYQMMRQEQHQLRMYGLTHAVFSGALCQLVAARMGWDESRQRSAMMAALTMNLTAFDLQARFAVHGRLTQEQRDELRQHPISAVTRLQAAGISDAEWLQAVLEHHEHADGAGYPRGITVVSELAQLLRLVDVFLAKISRRESRPPMDCKEAARQAYAQWPGHPMVATLIKEFGLYPPGELVDLASGEKAVVIRRGSTLQTPLAATLTDKHGLPSTQTFKRDTGQAGFAIKAVETDKGLAARVPLERLYGLIG
ncbi:HD domain-containing phosphohydrolase [Pelomonas sp. SE-A7]|uniref:HD-GYP domain-containing protein n=1 Tax=Pelomonas sp. SE-A7 TaxID=3054953 RepID=UPI00259D1F62|nr:HD domain-containing phosphohydrolase [Pelomonas sp. SE-A7]MDM4767602.1 HD domain-containing phosphohydrolase [Pelomonas sp. SE-A7]